MKKRAVSILVLALAATGAYWYWSPYLAMHSMRAAAIAKDAEAFNERVDYPRIRESIKGQMAARLADIAGTSKGGSEAERAGSALGAMLGMAMVGPMVDAMVRPEVVMRAMVQGKTEKPAGRDAQEKEASSEVKWVADRKGVDKIVVYVAGKDATEEKIRGGVSLSFERTGFANWKLVELRLPQ